MRDADASGIRSDCDVMPIPLLLQLQLLLPTTTALALAAKALLFLLLFGDRSLALRRAGVVGGGELESLKRGARVAVGQPGSTAWTQSRMLASEAYAGWRACCCCWWW